MKKTVLKTYGAIIGAILSFLGIFTSCRHDDGEELIAEYGIPVSHYIIKGNVKDAQTNAPIQSIRIVVPNKNQNQSGGDTVYTDKNGNYEVKDYAYLTLGEPFKLIASDVDGSANRGYYQPDTLKLEFTDKDKIAKSNGWVGAAYQKTGQNFSLKYGAVAMYGVMRAAFKKERK